MDLPSISVEMNTMPHYTELVLSSGVNLFQNAEEFHESYSIKRLHTEKSIVEYWDEIVEMGTDIHRLKFHSKLLDMHIKNHEFTAEELLVYFKSSYSVVGIQYFTNNILVARSISADTESIYKEYRNILLANFETNIMEITIWELLTISAAVEVENFDETGFSFQNNLTNKFQNAVNNVNNLLSNGENYTCSYVFFFRSVLLDENLHYENSQLRDCATLLNDGKIMNCDNHTDNNKYQLYVNIILSMYDPEVENIKGITSLYHLLNALKIPVFTSEDRLLNYKVTIMAMKKISDCVNRNVEWLEYENDCLCNTLKANRQTDKDLNIILTKLTYMQVYQMTTDDSNFIPDYRNQDGTIDENKLHMIVTMGLDNMDTEFNSSPKRVIIVNETIRRLSHYVSYLESKTSNTEELIRAHKWLAELHGVLCTNSNNETDIESHQNKLEKSLTMAITLKRNSHFHDDHLEFLFYKKICKDSQLSYFWERQYKADGWIQKLPSDSDGNNHDKIFQGHDCERVYLFLGLNNKFIHEADVNILIFKHLMKLYNNVDSISKFVKDALSHWVVTSEDRVRNLQAHELYSMYFVWRNYRIAKENGAYYLKLNLLKKLR